MNVRKITLKLHKHSSGKRRLEAVKVKTTTFMGISRGQNFLLKYSVIDNDGKKILCQAVPDSFLHIGRTLYDKKGTVS